MTRSQWIATVTVAVLTAGIMTLYLTMRAALY